MYYLTNDGCYELDLDTGQLVKLRVKPLPVDKT